MISDLVDDGRTFIALQAPPRLFADAAALGEVRQQVHAGLGEARRFVAQDDAQPVRHRQAFGAQGRGRYAGDDYVLLRANRSAPPTVYGLYRTAKLRPRDLAERFPNLWPRLRHLTTAEYDKAVLLVGDDHRDLLADGVMVRAIVIAKVGPSGTALRPASAIEVLMALAPTTLFQLPGAGKEALQAMSAMVQNVPGYRLEVGPDLDEVVGAIRRLLTDGQRVHG